MGRLICCFTDASEELYERGPDFYMKTNPDEYYWLGEEDEEESMGYRMEMGYSPVQD